MIFKRKTHMRTALTDIIWILLFILILILSAVSIRTVIKTNNEEGIMIIEQSIRHAAVSCYVLEGRYPEDINYLLDNYNIIINTERYVIHYSATGPNLMPDIAVLSKNAE